MNNLGILFLQTDRPQDAEKVFRDAIRLAPKFDQCYLNLAHVYADENLPEKAHAVLNELLKQYPNHPVALRMIEQLKQ
jgi:tetratricopeptide (TPR) repeat protein